MAGADYVFTARRVRDGRFQAEPGPVRYLKVPADAPVPTPAHQMGGPGGIKAWVAEVRALADANPNPHAISPAGDVLVFVHGYNNDLPIIMQRQRRLAADLRAEGWRGVVVSFDWPSDDSTLNYLEDRWDAAEVALSLVTKGIKVLARGQENGCETNVHLLGHSTGAYVILEAFTQAEKDGNLFKSDWRMGQVAFIGGDVSRDCLSTDDDWSAPLFKRIMRLTNYANPFDGVLAVSNAKRLGVSPRVGRVGLPANARPKAVNVDCGEHFQTLDPDQATYFGTFNHSWHIGDRVFARDLAMSLEGGIDRQAIPTRRREGGRLVLQDAPRPAHMGGWWQDGQG